MNIPKQGSIKEFIEFLLINILCLDSTIYAIVLLILTFKLDMLCQLYLISNHIANNILICFATFHIVLKFLSIILYYKFEYLNISNILILKLFEKMKQEQKIKFWLLFIITIPYQFLLVCCVFATRSVADVIGMFIISLCISAVIPYILLFIYMTYEKFYNKYNNHKMAIIIFVKKYIIIWGICFFIIFMLLINLIFDLIPYKGVGRKIYQELSSACPMEINVSNVPQHAKYNGLFLESRLYSDADKECFEKIEENYTFDVLKFLGDKVEKKNTTSFKKYFGKYITYYDYKNLLIMVESYDESHIQDVVGYKCRYDNMGRLITKSFYINETDYVFNRDNEYVYDITTTHFGSIVSKKKYMYKR